MIINVLLGEWAPFYESDPSSPSGHGGFCWDLLQAAKTEMEAKRNISIEYRVYFSK